MDTEDWYDEIARGIYRCCYCGLQFEDYKSMVEHIKSCDH